MSKPIVYKIRIQEQLDDQWAEWFAPLVIQRKASGETSLIGPVRDQAELFGLLLKIANLNLTLLAICRVETGS